MLKGKVAVVTGASRGLGRGIALQLGEAGATVYITGRKPGESENPLLKVEGQSASKDLPSLSKTADEINARGGRAVLVYCNHTLDSEIESLFDQVNREQNGQLDILVNNAFDGVDVVLEAAGAGKKFYDMDPHLWDQVNGAGLRNHYFCTVLGARMMVKRRSGLIVILSSMGGLRYAFNVCYGVGKAGCDRIATDCGYELTDDNVACVSLWPGSVRTELIDKFLARGDVLTKILEPMSGLSMQEVFAAGESPHLAGKAVVHLAADRNVMNKTGRVLYTAKLAEEYGFNDIDDKPYTNLLKIKDSLALMHWNRLAAITPGFLKIPEFVMTLLGSKF